MDVAQRDLRAPGLRRKVVISVIGAVAVTAALAVELIGRGHQFTAALASAPVWVLSVTILLQGVSLLARTEAWNTCVRATGATVSRRVLFRAAGFGYLLSLLNGSLGLAARIASLRRAAPDTSPRVPALLAAEVPIISVEVLLTAVFSFTLIGPLGTPWWVPLIAVLLAAAVMTGLRRLSARRQLGLWKGLAVMRRGRGRMVALVLLAIGAQVARNWLVLWGVGVHVSPFDAIALLITMFTLGQLPIGPSLGAAATVLILGSHGVATAAAAGVLLTATATIGSLGYASWAGIDLLLSRRSPGRTRARPRSAAAVAPALSVRPRNPAQEAAGSGPGRSPVAPRRLPVFFDLEPPAASHRLVAHLEASRPAVVGPSKQPHGGSHGLGVRAEFGGGRPQ